MTLTRRDVFATAGAAAATLAVQKSANAQSFDFKPNQRYPDASVEILDPSFAKYRLFSITVEQVATGMRWAEGPVWFGDGRYVLVSDIPNNRIMRYDEATGNWGVFRHPSNFANGNARDRQGRLITCEHLTRRVTRTEYDGKITVLADNFNGKRLNSPNDIVCKSDGSIWFTDPPFGIGGDWEGDKQTSELPHSVYRIAPDGKLGLVTAELAGPNGLAFSPDEKKIYIIESRAQPNRLVWSFDVGADGFTLSNKTKLIDGGATALDGMKVDTDGNHLVRLGQHRRCQQQRRGTRRRESVQSRRQGDRLHSLARALSQSGVRRCQKEPPVHGEFAFALRPLRRGAGRGLTFWGSPDAVQRAAFQARCRC